MRILLLILVCFWAKAFYGQDSTTALYINEVIRKIENRLAGDVFEKKDTAIFEKADSLRRGTPLTVRTEFFMNRAAMEPDKIVEKSRYRTVSTELTVYFLAGQPIRFTNKQWKGSTLEIDFDVYYMNNCSVYFANRKDENGTPDCKLFLNWCYDLLKEYDQIAREYNPGFQGRLR